ncbi:MAG: CdaR family protein [bacterium]
MFRRALTENLGIKILALLLAVGMVYARTRKQLTTQNFSSVLIEITSIPTNMIPANRERTYTTNIALQGPQTVLNFLSPKDLRFTLDLTKQKELIQNRRLLLRLGPEYFTAKVKEQERQQLILEEIRPSQVLITVNLWNIAKEQPPIYTSEVSEDIVEIPLYQLIKDVPIRAPTLGHPPEGRKISIETIPNMITLTGPEAALGRISEVTTTPINVATLIESVTIEATLPLLTRSDSPVSATMPRVIVKIEASPAKGGK